MPKKKKHPEQYPQAIEFSEHLIQSHLWISKAEELLDAARLLEADILDYWSQIRIENGRVVDVPSRKNVQGPYFMLIAYAVENYCKALLVHINRDALRNRLLGKIPDYLKEHNLLNLVANIQLDVTVSEEDLLTRLTRNSIWASRYPVPTGPNGMAAVKEFSDGKVYLTAYFDPQDVDRVHGFVERLSRYVQERTSTDV